MSKKFDMISIFLIVVLVIILFFVIFGYFTGSSFFLSTVTPSVDVSSVNTERNNSIISKNSGETILPNVNLNETPKMQENITSGEITISENIVQSGEQVLDVPSASSPSNPLIITSDSNISSKEKKEVLKELDQTLMELLEVVDSVKTVDETRLTPDESEVQQ